MVMQTLNTDLAQNGDMTDYTGRLEGGNAHEDGEGKQSKVSKIEEAKNSCIV